MHVQSDPYYEDINVTHLASWAAELAPLTSCCATEVALTLPLT